MNDPSSMADSRSLKSPADLFRDLLERKALRRFPDGVEQAFQLHYLREERTRTRAGLFMGLLLFLAYGFWDLMTFPQPLLAWSIPLRFLVVCPLYAAVLLASYFRERVLLMDCLRVAAILASASTAALLSGIGPLYGVAVGLEGIFLITIAGYTLTGLRTRLATIAGLAMLPMLCGVGYFALGSPGALLDVVVFSLTANVMGFVACATHERTSRENFLRMRLLDRTAAEDSLTSLPNRRAFEDHLAHIFPLASRHKFSIAVALVDIDHFKQVNDLHGHAKGDACLKQVAEALSRTARRPLDIAGRIGGEEFAIAWFEAGADQAQVLAENARANVSACGIEIEAGRPLTVSVGAVCVKPSAGVSFEQAIVAADEALYEAKAAGRDCSVVRVLSD